MNYLNDLWRQCGSPWAPGMLALQDAYFVTRVDAGWCDEGGNVHATRPRWRRRLLGPDEEYHEPEEWPPRWHGGGGGSGAATPDWSDAATVGCLLGMVREEWGEPTASAQLTPNGDPVDDLDYDDDFDFGDNPDAGDLGDDTPSGDDYPSGDDEEG